jgi:hypothetical protein
MPYWFTKAQWHLQFPKEVTCATHIRLNSIKTNLRPTDHLKYCPAWTAGQKKGWLKKQQRWLGITNHIKNSAKKRRTTRKRGRRPLIMMGSHLYRRKTRSMKVRI